MTSNTQQISLQTTVGLLSKSQWVERHNDEGSERDRVTWAYLNQVRAQ